MAQGKQHEGKKTGSELGGSQAGVNEGTWGGGVAYEEE